MKAFLILCGALILCIPGLPQVLRLEQRIPLPGVEGRIDHLAVDLDGRRLFVAALGNGTLEIVDLKAGQRTRTIRGLKEPQGVAYIPGLNRLFVANGGDGVCRIFDGTSLRPVGAAKFGSDADNLRYDPSMQRVYAGYGDGALGALDASTGARIGDVGLRAHPESFQLEKTGPLIFVNVPRAAEITVIDRRRMSAVAHWRVRAASQNFPLAFDEEHHRLFAGCRKPPRVLVYDSITGSEITSFDCAGDTDDLFYDAARNQLYISGGEGFVTVEKQRDPDRYELVQRVATAPGARTSLFVRELNRLYVAAPKRAGESAEILEYTIR